MWRVNSDAMPTEQDEDQAAAELLYVFMLNRAIKVSLSTLKKEPRLYVKPVYTVKADESEALEEIADSKPHIKFKNDKAWFTFQKARGRASKSD